jgi:hypothetical protein
LSVWHLRNHLVLSRQSAADAIAGLWSDSSVTLAFLRGAKEIRAKKMVRRKTIAISIGGLLIAAFLYLGVWPFLVGGGRMESFCLSLETGTPISRVRDVVQQKQYRVAYSDKTGQAIIHDPRSFGRFVCEVQFKDERLVSARYQDND